MSTVVELEGATMVAPVKVEPREDRVQRLSTGTLLVILGALLAWASFGVVGAARLALSDAFAEKKLPIVSLPGRPTVTICAALVLLVGLGYLFNVLRKGVRGAAGAVAGVVLLVGLIAWAAAGSALPLTVANLVSGTLTVAIPLVLGALAGVFSERAGVVNVAIEGQLLTSAFAAAVVGSLTQSILMGVLAAVITGALMSGLLALFALKYLVDHVILGVVINLLAAGLTGFLLKQLIGSDARRFNSVPIMDKWAIPFLRDIPFFGPTVFTQTPLAYAAVLAVPVAWWLIFKTKWGLRVRAVGEHPHAADTVGINVIRTKASSVLVGGLFAGLGGAYFTVGSVGAFSDNMTAGKGFIALAALIMGRWHPVYAAFMAVFFGFLVNLGSNTNLLGVSLDSQLLSMVPYVATIIAVAGLVGRVRGPAADGLPFVKE